MQDSGICASADIDADVRRGEYISGFYVRAGAWIDAIQILTSLGRRSPWYGNAHGGTAYVKFSDAQPECDNYSVEIKEANKNELLSILPQLESLVARSSSHFISDKGLQQWRSFAALRCEDRADLTTGSLSSIALQPRLRLRLLFPPYVYASTIQRRLNGWTTGETSWSPINLQSPSSTDEDRTFDSWGDRLTSDLPELTDRPPNTWRFLDLDLPSRLSRIFEEIEGHALQNVNILYVSVLVTSSGILCKLAFNN